MDGLKGVLRLFLLISVVGTIIFTYIGLSDTKTTQLPEPSELFFVDDYSGVFTEDTENVIFDQIADLYAETGAQICVVAVPNTQADSLEDFSLNLANSWGIGDKDEDNGVLILFTTQEPHVRLEVGKGLEGCIPDAKAGRILDEWAVEAIKAGEWNKAARNTSAAVAQLVYEEYGLEVPKNLVFVKETDENPEEITLADADFPEMTVEKNKDPIWMVIGFAFVMTWLIGIIPFLAFLLVWKFWWKNDFEDLMTLSSIRDHIVDDSDSGGGGFSGGGGSFGGGGASR